MLEKELLFLKAKKCHFEQQEVDFLGYVISQGMIKVDPSKWHGLDEWPWELKNVKEVQSTLEVLGYQRQFIPQFTHLAYHLNKLLKKNKKFKWTEECTQAVDALIKAVTSNPVLLHPDFKKPFVLEVDASQYATRAILYQQDDEEHWRPVGYYLKSFNEAEWGYDIHDWELLAIVQGWEHWRHLLLSSPFKVTVISDHLNLKYYREPRKINWCVARYLPKLGEFNLQIVHKPGKTNKADLLSQQLDFDQGKNDNEEVLVLPPELFINMVQVHQTLEDLILKSQQGKEGELKCLREEVGLQSRENRWVKNTALVVMDPTLYKKILELYHDHPLAGHPGILKMLTMVLADYWWPGIQDYITKYVQGCATCRSTKSGTTRPKVPLMPITAKQAAPPFATVALDRITDLPLSNRHDTILTITDHDCSKAAIFIPCSKTIDAEGVAQLYIHHVFPHYGVPQKVISDRDPRFTAKFMWELCKQLHIDQNISSAYHPQTDGQSEWTNQWLEQYLCIYGNFQQNDWASWLPLAQWHHQGYAFRPADRIHTLFLADQDGLNPSRASQVKRMVNNSVRTSTSGNQKSTRHGPKKEQTTLRAQSV
jgi:RNase H-like domain found in reverse transcriptase/Integrase zinc binding domain